MSDALSSTSSPAAANRTSPTARSSATIAASFTRRSIRSPHAINAEPRCEPHRLERQPSAPFPKSCARSSAISAPAISSFGSILHAPT
jgi:hypothetical protein